MIKKITSILIAITLLQSSIICLGQDNSGQDTLERKLMELAILDDLERDKAYDSTSYQTLVILGKAKARQLDIIEWTTNPDSILYWASGYGEDFLSQFIRKDSTWVVALKNYNSRIGKPSEIKRELLAVDGYTIEVVKQGYIKRTFKKEKGWKSFYDKYPKSNGFYEISRPIITENKAVLYFSQVAGGLNGVGKIIMLEKKAKWKVVHFIELWVS